MDTITLINVSSAANHNKFYRLTKLANGTTLAEWGRVGTKGQRTVYEGRNAFADKLGEKLRRGYVEARIDAAHLTKARTLLATLEAQKESGARISQAAKEEFLEIAPQRITEVSSNNWMTRTWFATQRALIDALETVSGVSGINPA